VQVLTFLHPPCAALRDRQEGEVKLALARVDVHDICCSLCLSPYTTTSSPSYTARSRVSASDRLRLRRVVCPRAL
jgi:hypothetical protein